MTEAMMRILVQDPHFQLVTALETASQDLNHSDGPLTATVATYRDAHGCGAGARRAQTRAEKFDRRYQPTFGPLASEKETLNRNVQSGQIRDTGFKKRIGQTSNIEDMSR